MSTERTGGEFVLEILLDYLTVTKFSIHQLCIRNVAQIVPSLNSEYYMPDYMVELFKVGSLVLWCCQLSNVCVVF